MNIYLAQQDLARYPTKDLATLAQYYQISSQVAKADLAWLIALSIHTPQRAQMLSASLILVANRYKEMHKRAEKISDADFPIIDHTFIEKVLELHDKERRLKKMFGGLTTDIKKATGREKRQLERTKQILLPDKIEATKELSELESSIKADPNYKILQQMAADLNIPPSSINWVIDSYLDGCLDYADIHTTLKATINDYTLLRKKYAVPELNALCGLRGPGKKEGILDLLDSMPEEIALVLAGPQGAELVYEGETIKVYQPTTVEGACYYGRGTKWCTSATLSENLFEEYDDQGPLYIIQPIKPRHTGEKYQLHFESEQYMDENDEEVELIQLFKWYPELVKVPDFYGLSQLSEYPELPNDQKEAFILRVGPQTALGHLPPTLEDYKLFITVTGQQELALQGLMANAEYDVLEELLQSGIDPNVIEELHPDIDPYTMAILIKYGYKIKPRDIKEYTDENVAGIISRNLRV